MNEFELYQVQHLLLLIGENPLPNYVATKALLKSGGTVYLIYTSRTQPQAERLRDRFSDLGYITQLVSIEGYESDSYYIQKYINEVVTQLPKNSIGLHYTGGTKAMSVHAYRALMQARPDAIFSYLDSRHLELCVDQKGGERFHTKAPIDLTLIEIFELHQLSLLKPAATVPKLPEVAIALAQLHSDQAIAEAWRNWCNKVKSPNSEKAEDLSIENLPPEIRSFFQQYCAVPPDVLLLQTGEIVESQKKEIRQWLDATWLDATWLEHYTLQQVQTIRERFSIFDSATSLKVRDPRNPFSTNEFFEFDVAFMRGYQLFALSCTTDERTPQCKHKLFEAYLRAKQLGGDEARVALVCCSDKPELLKTRLEIMLENPQIAVFGRQHLMNLAEHIERWIIKNDYEAQ